MTYREKNKYYVSASDKPAKPEAPLGSSKPRSDEEASNLLHGNYLFYHILLDVAVNAPPFVCRDFKLAISRIL